MARSPLAGLSATSSKEAYCPEQFDCIWIQFDPQAGREQAGHRPAFVLSPRKYNAVARLCVLCPITTKPHGYPFEVPIPDGLKVEGAVISDQMKSMSWSERGAAFIGNYPELASGVQGRIRALLGF